MLKFKVLAEKAANSVIRKRQRFERNEKSAIRASTDTVRLEVRSRVYLPRQVSKQDDNRPLAAGRNSIRLTGRSPVKASVSTATNTGRVKVLGHLTPARTAAIRKIVPLEARKRTGLVVKPLDRDNRAGATKTYTIAGQTYYRLKFSNNPKLRRWAYQPKLGRFGQWHKHVIRLGANETGIKAREKIMVEPSRDAAEPKVLRIYRKATVNSIA